MNSVAVIVGISNSFSGVLIILLAIPLIRRSVKMNDAYGFRFKSAFRSEARWLEINEFGGRRLAAFGSLLLLVGVISLIIPMPESVSVYLAFAPILVVVPCALTYNYSKKLVSD